MTNETKQAKFTQGDWEITRNSPTDRGWNIVAGTTGNLLATIHPYSPRSEVEANAYLMAAAPTLYEALSGLLEYHRRDDYIGLAKDYQIAAENALAKANGPAVGHTDLF